MKRNVLVTGGAGYIGSHTCVELVNNGYHPIIIDNFSNSKPFIIDRIEKITNYTLDFIEGDCCDYEFLNGTIKKYENIVGCIHFAAYKQVGESCQIPLEYYQNNLYSLISLLKCIKNSNCKTIVFSSSCSVYGNSNILPVVEDMPEQQSLSPYGRTKQFSEKIIEDLVSSTNDIKAHCLRYFNPIGAHPSSLIGELPLKTSDNLVPIINKTVAGQIDNLLVYGNDYDTPDGTCVRDYIHVMDVARAHVCSLNYLLNQSSPVFDKINIGTGKGSTVLELIKTFEKVNEVRVNHSISSKRHGDVSKVYADVTKSFRLLKWKAKESLADSLKDSWNWQKSILNNEL